MKDNLITPEEAPQATGWEVQADVSGGILRLVLLDEAGAIGSIAVNAPEAYTLAQRILRGYDKLEGI